MPQPAPRTPSWSAPLIAVSAAQSADGRVADLDALYAASHATGARVLLDTTQAVGWLPVDASRFVYTACGGYKWLSPRGTADFTISPALINDLTPHFAGWFAGSARGYQRDLRDVGGYQTSGRLNMQPSGLNIYASQSCPENARSCRREVVADVFMSPKTLTDLGEVLCHESLADPFHPFSGL